MLTINATSIAKYGRKVGQKLWSDDEITAHMISPRKSSGASPRVSFDSTRKTVWEGNIEKIGTNLKQCMNNTEKLSSFVSEVVRKKYSNSPLQAYEEAKESFNRLGNEILSARKQNQVKQMAQRFEQNSVQ